MKTRSVVLSGLLSLSALFAAAPAHSQAAPEIDLDWAAPPHCPQQREVRDRIRKLAGASKSTETPLHAEGTITPTEDGRFRLKLVVRAGELVGERNIESASCQDLAGAAAVTLGLLLRSEAPIDDLAQSPASTPSATGTESSTSGPSKTGDESEQARASEAGSAAATDHDSVGVSQRSLRGILQAPLVALSVGPLPEPVLGFGLGGGVSFPDWRLLLEGQKWLEQSVPAEDFPGFGADVERLTVTLRGCRAFRWERVALAPCLFLSLEHLTASGTGPDVAPSSQETSWLAPGAGVQGVLLLTSWFNLVASIDGRIETARPRITIEGVGDVEQVAPVAVTVLLGSEWIL
jgi:hypothetical protein